MCGLVTRDIFEQSKDRPNDAPLMRRSECPYALSSFSPPQTSANRQHHDDSRCDPFAGFRVLILILITHSYPAHSRSYDALCYTRSMSTTTPNTGHQMPPNVVPARRPLPKGWKQVVGMLKGRRKSFEAHVKKMRNEWDRPLGDTRA